MEKAKTKTSVTLQGEYNPEMEKYEGCLLMWPKLAEPGKHNEDATPKYEVELQNLCKEDVALLKTLDPPFVPNDGKKRERPEKGLYCTPKSVRPVPVYDSDVEIVPLEQVAAIGNESRGNVTVHSYSYSVGGNSGVALGLDSVQITDLKVYNNNPYLAVEGGYQSPKSHETADDVPF